MTFQTPIWCCKLMRNYIPIGTKTVWDPTPGECNLFSMWREKKYEVTAPKDFWRIPFFSRYDCIVMTPPFSPMKVGYKILYRCMTMSDHIIALMPWLVLINSVNRTSDLFGFGLVSVTHLP